MQRKLTEVCPLCGKEISEDEYVVNWAACSNCFDAGYLAYENARRERMKIMKIQANPIILEAIKWENNEAEIRDFVKDDKALRFLDRGLEVWTVDTESWNKCEMFHFIAKTNRGGLLVLSPRDMETNYSIVE